MLKLGGGGVRGVQKDSPDHANLVPRNFTESGLTKHQKIILSYFLKLLEGSFITQWSQNRPFRPRHRKHEFPSS